jgi:hypothetical protein
MSVLRSLAVGGVIQMLALAGGEAVGFPFELPGYVAGAVALQVR